MLFQAELTVKYDVDICIVGGVAAGVAAAFATKNGDVRSVDIGALQDALIELGANLPNRK